MKTTADRKPQPWPLAKLRDHPQQVAIFGDLGRAEFDAFVANMKKGQRDPTEILPCGLVVSGHQRVRAARELGWDEIEVIVRSDLAEAGPTAVEEHFIEDNLRRRQLTPLGKARCIARLMEIETGRRVNGLVWNKKKQFKAALGKQLGISLRSVNRYLLALEAPPAVQGALDRGELTLTVTGKVAMLHKYKQAEIGRRIEAGERASLVVAEYLAGPAGDEDRVGRSIGRLFNALKRELPNIESRIEAVDPRRLRHSTTLLERAGTILAELSARVRERTPSRR